MNMPSPNPTPAATPESPWLGLGSFPVDAQPYFFGRDDELEDLYERILDKPLTVLFGRSGIGKSSVLQAGLVPRLRSAGFLPVFIRFNHDANDPSLEQQLLQALRAALESGGYAQQASRIAHALSNPSSPPDYSAILWLLFHDPAQGFMPPRGGDPAGYPRPVFLIDQFEEIFTFGERPQRRPLSAAFRETLAALVENRPPASLRQKIHQDDELAERLDYKAQNVRVLVSLREDFLHLLERWRRAMPSLMENRLELRTLSGPKALLAVTEPGRLRPGMPDIIPHQVGEAVVRFVAGANPDEPLDALEVAPPLLSLVCSELNAQRLAAGEAQVTQAQFEGHSGDILTRFYERSFDPATYGTALADVPDAAAALKDLRRLIEDRLLSADGFRENIALDTISRELSRGRDPNAAAAVLDQVVQRRLLTLEERGGVRRIELAHDVLTGVVRASRDERYETEAAARAEAAALQREKEVRAKLQQARRRFAWVCAVVVVMLGLVVHSYYERRRAEREQHRAEWEQQRAELARKGESQQRENAEKARDSAVKSEERARKALADAEESEKQAKASAKSVEEWFVKAVRMADWRNLSEIAAMARAKPGFVEWFSRTVREQSRNASDLAEEVRLKMMLAHFEGRQEWSSDEIRDATDLLMDAMNINDRPTCGEVVNYFKPISNLILQNIGERIGEYEPFPANVQKSLFIEEWLATTSAAPTSSLSSAVIPRGLDSAAQGSGPSQKSLRDRLKEYKEKATTAGPVDLAAVDALLAAGRGLRRPEYAFCQTLPLKDALTVNRQLLTHKYQLCQFRPSYTASGRVSVAAIWRTGGRRTLLQHDTSVDHLRHQLPEMAAAGFAPEDVTCYVAPDPRGGLRERIAVVWKEDWQAASLQPVGWLAQHWGHPRWELALALPEAELRKYDTKFRNDGLFPQTVQFVFARDGTRRFYGIWREEMKSAQATVTWDLPLQDVGRQNTLSDDRVILLDARPQVHRDDISPRLRWERALQAGKKQLDEKPNDLDARIEVAKDLVHLGQYEETLRTLAPRPSDPAFEKSLSVHYWRAIANARLGRVDTARRDTEAYARIPDVDKSNVTYLSGIVAASSGGEIPPEIDSIIADRKASSGDVYNAACVYAWAAGRKQYPEAKREHFARRAIEALGMAVDRGASDYVHFLVESDLEPIRTRPEFHQLLGRIPPDCVTVSLKVPSDLSGDVTAFHAGLTTDVLAHAKSAANDRAIIACIAAHNADAQGGVSLSLWTRVGQADVAAEVSDRTRRRMSALRQTLAYGETSGSARQWWDLFEKENALKQSLVIMLMKELANRKATIQEFFLAYVYSSTDNILGNLHYMDFTRIRKDYDKALKADPLRVDPFAKLATEVYQGREPATADQKASELLKGVQVPGWASATPEAKQWWTRVTQETSERPAVLLKLIEEIQKRKATLDELFLAAAYSDTDDARAHLYFLDYSRLRDEEANKKRAAAGAPQKTGSISADALRRYAIARLIGAAPSPVPLKADSIRTQADFQARFDDLFSALADYPGEISTDLAHYAARHCAKLFEQAFRRDISPDIVEVASRLSKSAKYLVHEKDITLYIFMNLPERSDLPEAARPAFDRMSKKMESTWDNIDDVARKWGRRPDSSKPAYGLRNTEEDLKKLCNDLGTAFIWSDLTRATALLQRLRPDRQRIRKALRDDAPADLVEKLLASQAKAQTPLQMIKTRGADWDPDAFVTFANSQEPHGLFTRWLNGEPTPTPRQRANRFLRRDVEFYEVVLGGKHKLHLLFWDGQRWTMLGPIWEALDKTDRPATAATQPSTQPGAAATRPSTQPGVAATRPSARPGAVK